MVRLTRLQIRSFRGIQGPLDLTFGPGHVFVVGSNGSGKSTLLDLIATLMSGDLESLLSEASLVDIQWEVATSAGSGEAAAWVLSQHLVIEPQPVVASGYSGYRTQGPDATEAPESIVPPAAWTYEATLKGGPFGEGGALTASSDERFTLQPSLGSKVASELKRVILKPMFFAILARRAEDGAVARRADGSVEPQPWMAARLFFPHRRDRLRRFGESLEGYQAIIDRTAGGARFVDTGVGLPGRYVPWAVESRLIQDDLLQPESSPPFQLVGATAEHEEPDGRVAAPSLLHSLPTLLGAERVTFTARHLSSEPGRSEWRGFGVQVRWPGSVVHSHEQLSFGQKRLLAFLWYTGVFTHLPLLTDELANGLHPGWVRQIADRLDGQQAIHALQNPLLLDWVGPVDRADLGQDFVLCSVDVVDGRRVWTWRNPTATEAERLQESWRAGFRNLSSILESEGWL